MDSPNKNDQSVNSSTTSPNKNLSEENEIMQIGDMLGYKSTLDNVRTSGEKSVES